MKVVITGASGFVGGAVADHFLRLPDVEVVGTYRRIAGDSTSPKLKRVEIGEIDSGTNWKPALQGADVIIHTAARVHEMRRTGREPREGYEHVNVLGTLNLARQAVDAGVRRFVFVSSIKVNGDFTGPEVRFRPEDRPNPADAYAKSKCEAEIALRNLSLVSDMGVVVVRPPLVYGPGVKANFRTLLHWVHSGWPIPMGSVDNRRSLLALENLVDFLALCAVHPAATNQTFTVADGEDVSTPELVRRIGVALGRPAKLVRFPPALIRASAVILGRQDQADRLLGSLLVDSNKARHLLGWKRVVDLDQALLRTAQDYLASI